MGKIEDILKLDNELSKKVEEAKERAKKIAAEAQAEADRIIASSGDELVSYRVKKGEELRREMGELRKKYASKFDGDKDSIMKTFSENKDRLKDYIVKKILGYDN